MKFRAYFYNQWEPLYKDGPHWNWFDFTIIGFNFECAPYQETFEIGLGILGLNLTLDWCWHKSTDEDRQTEASDGN